MNTGESILSATPQQEVRLELPKDSLIEQRPNQLMRLCVVVPMYAEYENGNVFRLIESFTKQSAPPESYEVICLVNNTPDAVRTRSNGYVENQLTLAIGKYINGGGALPEGLNDYRRGALEKAKEKGIVLHMVDFSTTGVERNIGKIRDIGLEEATRRFQTNGQGQEGLVAQMDADTIVEPHYVEKILQYFSDPKVESLFINLDYFTSEGTEDLFRTSFHHQYQIAFDQWINTLGNSKVEVGGPQTIARVKAYQRIGGIVHQDMAEDFRLSESLSNQTEYRFAPDIRVYTSDRAREEGYDARMRLERMTGEEEFRFNGDMTYLMPRVMFLIRELEALARTNPTALASEEQVKTIFDRYGVPFNYSKFREKVLDKSSKTRDGQERPLEMKVRLFTTEFIGETGVQTYAKSNEYVDDAVRTFMAILPPVETAKLEELVRQNVLRASVRLGQSRTAIREAIELVYKKGSVSAQDFLQTPKTQEFIERNPWLIEKLNMLRKTHTSPEEAISELQKEFPEWTESFENSRLRRGTAVLQALTFYLREARNNPEEYPTTNEFLKRLER
jgi:hypothetical protein